MAKALGPAPPWEPREGLEREHCTGQRPKSVWDAYEPGTVHPVSTPWVQTSWSASVNIWRHFGCLLKSHSIHRKFAPFLSLVSNIAFFSFLFFWMSTTKKWTMNSFYYLSSDPQGFERKQWVFRVLPRVHLSFIKSFETPFLERVVSPFRSLMAWQNLHLHFSCIPEWFTRIPATRNRDVNCRSWWSPRTMSPFTGVFFILSRSLKKHSGSAAKAYSPFIKEMEPRASE